ncbi:undecaprenyldiphospho-muramoylpentapeptide beta-N-acetylglucosaminyltransferase [Mesohalobacter halotolerans]|uniref:UDP-N-acetylglucosamine--N-acetylmuramyl-(pentapeptide) pyrophosphoryl-undecaprenol N-acetylglucosamine transferase n=1 Tax=Mesohalobacter halotolerans TaxID=1883405 RepID=A0A4U5TVL9_9FLAO|nr:undecaprenyldiphospho-muramoylpentapeptide beta-N-acetylglucosaminyltransferase [Mesohalobacter halotolerans]MBS3739079.1 undecaprenyldiphospho-muramoylpentapeptide beta-N-acetylglucosaminyltransferase [Psychroflexus sp.]TKS57654.1 undecaprenyldiphospho-muramoylpentapeptide beta-N-acetylglucosaminyltransferase [Mesohalobacter halotolerans]
MTHWKVIISGGGTGGHIYPAVAIAQEIKKRKPDADILFVGAKDRMEMQKVPKAGFKIIGLWISGLQRKLTLSNLLFPVKLLHSLIKSRQILKKHQPDIVIGTGGFASAPLLKMANMMNFPTLIQEQNSYAGVTNKWVAKKANAICVAYDNMDRYFPKDKITWTGNPVRQDLIGNKLSKQEALSEFNLNPQKQTLLVIGGSLGASVPNKTISKHLKLIKKLNCNLLWQCGAFYFEKYKHLSNDDIKILKYIENMQAAYAAADIIISRAGAGAVSELSLVAKPVIFIPSPNVAENHQFKNAQSVAKHQAAICIEEHELDQKFETTLNELIEDKAKQQQLSINIKSLAKPQATKDIVDIAEKIINNA